MTEQTVTIPTFDLAAVLVLCAAMSHRTPATTRCWLALTEADRALQEQALLTIGERDEDALRRIGEAMLDMARGDLADAAAQALERSKGWQR